jgi:hypothetical protein
MDKTQRLTPKPAAEIRDAIECATGNQVRLSGNEWAWGYAFQASAAKVP